MSLEMEGALLGMGNPLLDISATVPMDFLAKYDLQLNNAVLAEEKHNNIFNDMIATFFVQYIAGGATQNSIRVAQWMLRTPRCTAYMGAIGSDAYGETLQKCATDDGVAVHYQINTAVPTGTTAVLVHDGERSLVANLAAANTFSPVHLETPTAKDMIERAKVYYSAGFFLTVSLDSMLAVAKHAVANNKIYCLNLSAPFIIQFFKDQLRAIMPYADFLFANESEAAVYGDSMGYGSDIATIALKAAAEPKASGARARIVVFTQGADATIVAMEGKVTSYPVNKLAKELLVDTNGAGDAFVGGFLAQLIRDKPIAECVRAGHFAAGTIIQRSGCSFPKECDYA